MATDPNKLNIEVAKLADLTPAPDEQNARIHGPLEPLIASLERFGQRIPLVIDAAGIIRKGNRTFRAMQAMGWETCNVARWDKDGVEAAMYAVTDNRVSEDSTWNEELLAHQLKEWAADGEDTDVLGFNPAQLERFWRRFIKQPDPPQKPQSGPVTPDQAQEGGNTHGDGVLPSGAASGTPKQPDMAHVKTIPLFIAADGYDQFMSEAQELMALWDYDSVSDVVRAAIEKCHIEATAE